MKVYRLILAFTLFSLRSHAQDFHGQAIHLTDSITHAARADSAASAHLPENYYMLVYDSVERSLVETHLNETLSKGDFSWPFWYLQSVNSLSPNADTHIHYPTQTGKYLLKSKYRISMYSVSNGCVFQQAFVLHDSLMLDAIRRKYGPDFFQRTEKEAAFLDARGRGLQLPFVQSPGKIARYLTPLFAHAPTTSGRVNSQPTHLIITFTDGKVTNACWGEHSFSGVQQSIDWFDPTDGLKERVQALRWTGPKFRGAPITARVYFDLEKRALQFLDF